jgi:hypothetical protein
MSAARMLLAVAALAGLTACPGPGNDCFDVGSPSTTAEPPPQLGVVGQPVNVDVEAFLPFTCDGTEQLPDGLSSEVYAPDNRLVPSTPMLRGSRTGAVHFTPDQPGRYHVLAAFEPVGGIRQVGVLAAVDRTSESPLLSSLPETCAQLERTARGTLLCGAAVVRGGQVAQRLGAPGNTPRLVAVAGDVVWAVDTSNVYRYVDTGAALTLSGQRSHGSAQPEFLLAREDELLVLHASWLQRFTFSAGTLTSTGLTPWDEVQATFMSNEQPLGFLVRAGDTLAVVGRGPLLRNEGFMIGTRACTYHLVNGSYVRTKEVACQEMTGMPEGIEDGVLWVRETGTIPIGGASPSETVRRYVLTQGRFEEQGSLLLGPAIQIISSLLRSTSVPVFGIGQPSPRLVVPTWRPAQRDLVLELVDRDLVSPSVSSTFFWGLGPTGLMRARARPSPP